MTYHAAPQGFGMDSTCIRRMSEHLFLPRESATERAESHAAPVPRGLVYVTDREPGISRLRRGAGFIYRMPDGAPLRSAEQIDRIRRLAIPPAYEQVWICPLPEGHIQATGRDARGRKQYRYHALWRTARDSGKFERMLAFGAALPAIRARVARDLRRPLAPRIAREAILAALVRLLDTTLIRIGNEEYARTNGSYGLTTLRRRHARVTGDRLQFRFRGKSGIVHAVALTDPRIARIVRRCQDLPGQELFHFTDEAGTLHAIGSTDVNEYLREAGGTDFTAKDFRTWHASVHALSLLRGCIEDAAPLGKARLNGVLAEEARRLGNTVAVCRKSYVHPSLLELAAEGLLGDRLAAPTARMAAPLRGLRQDESRFLRFLRAL